MKHNIDQRYVNLQKRREKYIFKKEGKDEPRKRIRNGTRLLDSSKGS